MFVTQYYKSLKTINNTCTYIYIYIYICICICIFACQQGVLKTFPGPGYLGSEDGIVYDIDG